MKENCKLPKRLFLIEDYGIQGLRNLGLLTIARAQATQAGIEG